LIRSRILLFYIALFCAISAVGAQGDPDALYRERADMAKAREAAEIWQARLAKDPADFESAWKVARAMYWLGTQGPTPDRRHALERGTDAGRQAAMIDPRRPDGHFWMAANMGALAESFGLRQGIRYRGPIKDALETVLRIDPAFQKGSADRALGRWYFRVPGLFGGSKKQSEEHLRKSLIYDPNSAASHFFLAETLLDMDRRREAIEEFQKVVNAPIDPDWEPEDLDFKARARAALTKLGR
jgi:tetratricopeptide (TPR) repeat protein